MSDGGVRLSGTAPADEADVYCTAAEWHGRMNDVELDESTRAAFELWFRADPRHAAAYEALTNMWSSMRAARADPRILALRREALAASVRLDQTRERRGRFSTIAWRAAIVLLVVGAASFALLSSDYREPIEAGGRKAEGGLFATSIGERSTITLSDGSTVVLDAQSRIEVAYSHGQRHVRLLHGRAWFQVAKDPSWPFLVDAAGERVTALGTAFDVRLRSTGESVEVTLAEGKVTVAPIRGPLVRLIMGPPPTSVLSPGDSLVVSNAHSLLRRGTNVARIGSWRQGQLVFDDNTLASAVEEMNRYSNTPIVLGDSAVGSLRVSGVFNAGHSRSFIETVTGHYPIIASERADGSVVLALKPPVS
jgi:transmembrane sensor